MLLFRINLKVIFSLLQYFLLERGIYEKGFNGWIMNVVLDIYFDLTSVNMLLELFLWFYWTNEKKCLVLSIYGICFVCAHCTAHESTQGHSRSPALLLRGHKCGWKRSTLRERVEAPLSQPGSLRSAHRPMAQPLRSIAGITCIYLPLTLNSTALLLGLGFILTRTFVIAVHYGLI